MPSLTVAGVIIRYGFYAVGMLVFGVIGLGITSIWNVVPKKIDAAPAFRVASGEFAGNADRQRGDQLPIRPRSRCFNTVSSTTAIPTSPSSWCCRRMSSGVKLVQDLNNPDLLRLKRPRIMSKTHYDLETRFGEFRATEMRVDTDGRWKQCLVVPQPLRQSDCGDHRLVLRRQRQQAKSELAGLHPRQDRARATSLSRRVRTISSASGWRSRGIASAEPVSQTTDTGHRGVSPPSRWSQPSAQYRRY